MIIFLISLLKGFVITMTKETITNEEKAIDENLTAQDRFDREFLLEQYAESFDVAEKYFFAFEEKLNQRILQRRQNSNGSSTQQ